MLLFEIPSLSLPLSSLLSSPEATLKVPREDGKKHRSPQCLWHIGNLYTINSQGPWGSSWPIPACLRPWVPPHADHALSSHRCSLEATQGEIRYPRTVQEHCVRFRKLLSWWSQRSPEGKHQRRCRFPQIEWNRNRQGKMGNLCS